ncbi:GAF domain-containing protein [Nocardia sp. NPDC050712]|uniref:GAF domain-containing protein n=1 Tax=Nocardia sp. NPDC050712 TaxID=3155518 RepID=UPI0034012CB8
MTTQMDPEYPGFAALDGRWFLRGVPQHPEQLSACVRSGLDQPEAMARIMAAARALNAGAGLEAVAEGVLAHAMSATAADFGNVQLLDPATGALRIVAHCGFDTEFLEYFTAVDDTASACGRAARESAQIAIADVRTDAGFAPHREIAAATGFRGVQSTPLLDSGGRLIGMVSTHFRDAHRPPHPELALLGLYGVFAGEVTARLLDAGRSAPAARDPLSALAFEPALPALDTLAFAELGERLVRTLFDGGLRLSRVRAALDGELVTPLALADARDALEQAVTDLDMMIRETGLAMLDLTSTVPTPEFRRRRRRR